MNQFETNLIAEYKTYGFYSEALHITDPRVTNLIDGKAVPIISIERDFNDNLLVTLDVNDTPEDDEASNAFYEILETILTEAWEETLVDLYGSVNHGNDYDTEDDLHIKFGY